MIPCSNFLPRIAIFFWVDCLTIKNIILRITAYKKNWIDSCTRGDAVMEEYLKDGYPTCVVSDKC